MGYFAGLAKRRFKSAMNVSSPALAASVLPAPRGLSLWTVGTNQFAPQFRKHTAKLDNAGCG
jgi:hypothetical protein